MQQNICHDYLSNLQFIIVCLRIVAVLWSMIHLFIISYIPFNFPKKSSESIQVEK